MIADPAGRVYREALARSRAQGQGPDRIRLTRPGAGSLGVGELRVVAVRSRPAGPEWVLAYEGYTRLPRPAGGPGRPAENAGASARRAEPDPQGRLEAHASGPSRDVEEGR